MASIINQFKKNQDKRRKQGKRYELNSIICLVLLGYMSGCSSLAKMYRFGKSLNMKVKLRLGFSSISPSHPTITKIIRMLDPEEFAALLSKFIGQAAGNHFTQIAIDGKSIRSTSSKTEGLLHLVSAFAPEIENILEVGLQIR
jgi:hypothetical protein